MEPPQVSIKFTLTADEAKRAGQAMANRSVATNVIFALVLFVPIALGAFIDVFSEGRVRRVLPLHLPMWWFGLLASLLLGGTLAVIALRSGRRAFATTTGKGETTVHFSKDGVAWEAPGVSSKISWNSLHRIVETPEFVLFYVSSAVAAALPRRALNLKATEHIHEARKHLEIRSRMKSGDEA